MELNYSFKRIHRGESIVLTADVEIISLTSSNTRVATVDEATKSVIGHEGGTALITATGADFSTAICSLRVMQGIVTSASEAAYDTHPVYAKNFPVSLYDGAYRMEHALFPLFGGQNITLSIYYNSTYLNDNGCLGAGWHHSFEKYIHVAERTARVYSCPSLYTEFVATNDDASSFCCTYAAKSHYELKKNNENSSLPYMLICGNERTEYYDVLGRLAKIIDHQGFEINFTFSGTKTTITDAITGQSMMLVKNTSGRLLRVYDESGREAVLSYTDGYLTQITDVRGYTMTFTYEDGRIKTASDKRNVVQVTNTYDNIGRLTEQKDAITTSAPWKVTYGVLQRTVTNRCEKQSVWNFNHSGCLIKYTDENTYESTYSYDERYNRTCIIDGRNIATRSTYNLCNQITSFTNKNNETWTFTYDLNGNLTTVTYPAMNDAIPQEIYAYNTRNQLIRYVDRRGTITVYTYDEDALPATCNIGDRAATVYVYSSGRLQSETDPLGNTTSFTYGSLGLPITQTNALNKTTSFLYDAAGNIIQTTYPTGKSVQHSYDANGRPINDTDENGHSVNFSYLPNGWKRSITYEIGVIQYAYDAEGRVLRSIDPIGNATLYSYDDGGRLSTEQLPDGATTRYEYDACGNVVKQINPCGGETVKTYDGEGNILTEATSASCNDRYTYNALGQITSHENAVGGVTLYEYSVSGDLLREQNPLGQAKSYTYDAYGNMLTETDARGFVTSYTYDAMNRLVTVKNALNQVTSYTYTALGLLHTVTDARGKTITYAYDDLGRHISTQDARGHITSVEYDDVGNITKQIDAKQEIIQRKTYDAMRRCISETDAYSNTTGYSYNDAGHLTHYTDAYNHVRQYVRNARGQASIVFYDATTANAKACTNFFDFLGNITSCVGPMGSNVSYTYDTMGRLTSYTTPTGGTVSRAYHVLGNVAQETNGRGQTATFSYDLNGQLISISRPEGETTYVRDANGNVLSISDNVGTVVRTYDALNRVTQYIDVYNRSIAYEYDTVGNITRITYPDSTSVTYTYDDNSNLIRVTDWQGRYAVYAYDENNRIVTERKLDGSTVTYTYDAGGHLKTAISATATATPITSYDYTYNNLGQLTEEKNTIGATKRTYTYDVLRRITNHKVSNLSDVVMWEENFTYDAAGNPLSTPHGEYTYNTNNCLSELMDLPVGYDGDGNLCDTYSEYYEYDSRNRLTYLMSPSAHYVYDAEDTRVRVTDWSDDNTFTFDTNSPLSRLLWQEKNGVITKYIWGVGLLAHERNDTLFTYHFDVRGSTVAITDSIGNITHTFQYRAYGAIKEWTGNYDILFLFCGKHGVIYDSAGYYMRRRYYNYGWLRFLSPDPVHGTAEDLMSLNAYSYCAGDPINNIDPRGEALVGVADNIALTENPIALHQTQLRSKQARPTPFYQNFGKFTKAIYIANTTIDEGLLIVGHTELYLWSEQNQKWYFTEFDTTGGNSIDEKKQNAHVRFIRKSGSSFYTPLAFDFSKGKMYVMLDGDFTKSAEVAYNLSHNQTFGKYDFLFHNCSDYTDLLLKYAKLEGTEQEILTQQTPLVSIPIWRVFAMGISREIDSMKQYMIDVWSQRKREFEAMKEQVRSWLFS